MLYQVLIVLLLLIAIAMISLILVQQGKGAGMGASFGAGASNTVFGSVGSGNFLTETYLSLRRLENEVIRERYHGQTIYRRLSMKRLQTSQTSGRLLQLKLLSQLLLLLPMLLLLRLMHLQLRQRTMHLRQMLL